MQKYLVSNGDIFTPFCYKCIQVTAFKNSTYWTSAWLSYCKTNKGAIFASQCRVECNSNRHTVRQIVYCVLGLLFYLIYMLMLSRVSYWCWCV